MHNSVRPFFSISCAALVAVLAAPVFGQGMGAHNGPPQPNAGDMASPAPMDRMDHTPGHDLRGPDRDFVMDAARGGMAEVEMGKLAVSKAVNPDVKSFGQRMVDDHSSANDKLREVATAKGLTLPSELDKTSRAAYRRLEDMSGEKFDRAYVDLMVKDHVKDVGDFDRQAKHGADPDVRQFASTTLPTLQEHLTMIKDLQHKVTH